MAEEQENERKIHELEELLRERDRQLRETDRQLRETDRQLCETDRQLRERDRQLHERDLQYYSLMDASSTTLMDLQQRTRERDSLICELKKKDEQNAYFMQQLGAKSKDYSCGGYSAGSSSHAPQTTQFQPILQNFGNIATTRPQQYGYQTPTDVMWSPYEWTPEFPYAREIPIFRFVGPQPTVQQVPYSHHTITTTAHALTTMPFYSLATSTSSQVTSYSQNVNLGPSNYPQQCNYGMNVPVCLQENLNVGPCSQTTYNPLTNKPSQQRTYATEEQKKILLAHFASDPRPSNKRIAQYAEETKLPFVFVADWFDRELYR